MSDKSVLNILLGVRDLLSVPERWTQGVGARDASGEFVDFNDPSIVCRCLYIAAATFCSGYAQEKAVAKALNFVNSGEMIAWNDDPTRTHTEVLTRIDQAIQRLTPDGAAGNVSSLTN